MPDTLGVKGRWIKRVSLYTLLDDWTRWDKIEGPAPVAFATAGAAFLPAPHAAASVATVSGTLEVLPDEYLVRTEGLGDVLQQCALRMLFAVQQRWHTDARSRLNWWTYGAATDGLSLWVVKVAIEEEGGPVLRFRTSAPAPLWTADLMALSWRSRAAPTAEFPPPAFAGELPAGLSTLIAFMTASREQLGVIPVEPPAPVL